MQDSLIWLGLLELMIHPVSALLPPSSFRQKREMVTLESEYRENGIAMNLNHFLLFFPSHLLFPFCLPFLLSSYLKLWGRINVSSSASRASASCSARASASASTCTSPHLSPPSLSMILQMLGIPPSKKNHDG